MQRGGKAELAPRERRYTLRHECNKTHPKPDRPADTRPRVLYRVHVRNTSTPERGSWATYVTHVRTRVGMSKAELARRLGVDRGTVHRWETGQTRPEDAVVVTKFADLFGLDIDEVLTEAGLRLLDRPARTDESVPLDPDVKLIMRRLADPNVTEAEKVIIRATLQHLARIADRQDRDQDKRDDEGRAAS